PLRERPLRGPQLGPHFPRGRLQGHERAPLPATRRLRGRQAEADGHGSVRVRSCHRRTFRRGVEVLEEVTASGRTREACPPGRAGVWYGVNHAGVAEWQTRRTQNPFPARACGFKSLLRHPLSTASDPTAGSPADWGPAPDLPSLPCAPVSARGLWKGRSAMSVL